MFATGLSGLKRLSAMWWLPKSSSIFPHSNSLGNSVTTCKSRLPPLFFKSQIRRSYATHRELYSRLSDRRRFQSGWSRWRGPLLFAAGVIAFDYFVLPSIMSLPFMTPIRRRPENVVYGIIASNVAGFLAWRIPGIPSQFMYRYGSLHKTAYDFKSFQMSGMAFSHQNFWHLAINMFVLYQFGVPIARWMGSSGFLECYLDSCVSSSLGSMVLPALLGQASLIPSLGASGAVFSCVGVFSYLIPNARIALWFIPLPIGAWYVFLLTLGYNAFAMASRRGAAFSGAGIDYAGHVAGSLCGVIYGWLTQQRINQQRRRQRSIGFW